MRKISYLLALVSTITYSCSQQPDKIDSNTHTVIEIEEENSNVSDQEGQNETDAISDYLFEISQEINESCPILADENTRLDNTVVLSNRTIQYNYTLLNLEKNQIDISLLEEELTPLLLEDVRTNPGLSMFRKYNVTMIYHYKNDNRTFLFEYKITPEMYN
ncbi:MAG: hypothetical protein ACI9O4_001234 [Chitinophagales bacterium]|jgi:hypothetical protein